MAGTGESLEEQSTETFRDATETNNNNSNETESEIPLKSDDLLGKTTEEITDETATSKRAKKKKRKQTKLGLVVREENSVETEQLSETTAEEVNIEATTNTTSNNISKHKKKKKGKIQLTVDDAVVTEKQEETVVSTLDNLSIGDNNSTEKEDTADMLQNTSGSTGSATKKKKKHKKKKTKSHTEEQTGNATATTSAQPATIPTIATLKSAGGNPYTHTTHKHIHSHIQTHNTYIWEVIHNRTIYTHAPTYK